ncbi:MAG TPA: serine hydrolase [Acidimicrobiales bacterium]|nr:serine hydrolase [Acidimicrobiales bacterium]
MALLPGAASAESEPCPPSPFDPELGAALQARWPGRRFTAAVLDLRNGCEHHLNPGMRITTASVFKVEVMAGVLLRAQEAGRPVSEWESARIRPMISQSANPPTNELFTSLGGVAGANRLHQRFGLAETTTTSGTWGLTSTTARDQLHLLEQVLVRGGPLGAAARQRAWDEMAGVVPEQRWGITEAVPAGWPVALKNGFAGSQCCGWRLNSVGKVRQDWLVAVLSDGWPSQEAGIEGNRFVNAAIATRLALFRTEDEPRVEPWLDHRYRELFSRPLDLHGRVTWGAALHAGVPPADLVAWLKGSAEYRARHGG